MRKKGGPARDSSNNNGKGREGEREREKIERCRGALSLTSHNTDWYISPLSSVVSFSNHPSFSCSPNLEIIFSHFGLADLTFLTQPAFSHLFFFFKKKKTFGLSLIESPFFLLFSEYILYSSSLSQWLPKPPYSSLSPLSLVSHVMVISRSCRLMGRRKFEWKKKFIIQLTSSKLPWLQSKLSPRQLGRLHVQSSNNYR